MFLEDCIIFLGDILIGDVFCGEKKVPTKVL